MRISVFSLLLFCSLTLFFSSCSFSQADGYDEDILNNHDFDGDGIPNDEDNDIDGDGWENYFDGAPYNYYFH